MSTQPTTPDNPAQKHTPYVPESMQMPEFTLRAVLIGLVMTAILGSANAYLGLKAGMTIAATYPAAVIGMALLRLMKGSLLEENIARTVGSIGESVAAGAIFTIPAFIMAGLWPGLTREKYWTAVALMMIGGTLGILLVTLLRRVMVEDRDLPFPESVAASEIHKAGQQGSKAAQILFANMGFGGFMYLLGAINIFSPSNSFGVNISAVRKKLLLRTSTNPSVATTITGGATVFSAPDISPAYLGVGYIIGPRLASLNFAGSVLAWGLLVPLLTFVLGPTLQAAHTGDKPLAWTLLAQAIYFSIVRPIAVGGMLVGASYTLFKMRKQLGAGIARAITDLEIRRRPRVQQPHGPRSEIQGGLRRRRSGFRGNDRALLLLYWARRKPHSFEGHDCRRGRGCGHDRSRILLRRRFRKSRGDDRLVQQSCLGPDALHAGNRCTTHGGPRCFGNRRRYRSAGHRRGHLRIFCGSR